VDKTLNIKALHYFSIGILIWLIISSFSVIIKQFSTFIFIKMDLSVCMIFYLTQGLILYSVFIFSKFLFSKILKTQKELKLIVFKLVLTFLIVEIIKIACYSTTPILVSFSQLTSINYYTELKNNTTYKITQIAVEYLKIIIVGLTIFTLNKKQLEIKTEP
jgi:hypothetical protein